MTALPNWGSLEKASDDAQTIDEAIAAAIAAHDADSTAHLGAGGSLASHKAEDMIDHPAGSVASDKLPQTRFVASSFESLDGWSQYTTSTGSVVLNFPGVQLHTGATSGSISHIYTGGDGFSNFDAAKDFFLKMTAVLSTNASQTVRLGIGANGLGDGFSGVGFKIVNGSLYGYYIDDESETAEAISGITITDPHVYEIRHYAADDEYQFYVDGVLKLTIEHSFTEPLDDTLFMFVIQSSASGAHSLYLADVVAQLEL